MRMRKIAQISIIGTLVILGIFLVIYLAMTTGEAQAKLKGFKSFSTNDDDNDGIHNFEDRCPCVAGISENKGCEVNYAIGSHPSNADDEGNPERTTCKKN